MTRGRVYVTVNQENNIKAITYYDSSNKRTKQIDITGNKHVLRGVPTIPHTHLGYEHDEKGTRNPMIKEKKMIERVKGLWYDYNNK